MDDGTIGKRLWTNVCTQVKVAEGRTDIVAFMPEAIYLMELKAGIRFDTGKHTVDEWVVDKSVKNIVE